MKPVEQNNDGDIPAFQFAVFYAALDDLPATVKWLERSVDAHEGGRCAFAFIRSSQSGKTPPTSMRSRSA
jgi:hypothetical protein